MIVIYFGRPADIITYVSAERWTLLSSSIQCVLVATISLVFSGLLATFLLVLGLRSNQHLKLMEGMAAALQTIPLLVIVTVTLLIQTQLMKSLNATLSAGWYCLLPVTVALMFPPLANGAGAISRMPFHLKAMLRLWDAPSFWRIRHIYLPLAMPDILTGVRTSATWAVSATLITEGLLNGVDGDSKTLGHFLVRPFSSSSSPGTTPSIIISSLLGFLVYLMFVIIHRSAGNRLQGKSATAEEEYPL